MRMKDPSGRMRDFTPVSCAQCNKLFYKPTRFLNSRPRHYCSPKCTQLANITRVIVECAWCKNKFLRTIKRSISSKSGLNFCSRKCKDLANNIEGLPQIHGGHYKGGISRYRERGFRIHGKKCQRCGYDKDEKMLDVHHKDGNRKNGMPENLEVTCVWCHALETRKVKIHNWNGGLAQSVERLVCIQEATGAKPVSSTNIGEGGL